MECAYNEVHAKELIKHYSNIPEELVLRTYTSRLLGENPNLVLHGGGNTSIKLIQKNILLEDQEILFVKGSGVDLATIEPEEFVALDLAILKNFRRLEKIDDEEMENQLQIHKLHTSPLNPSVESFLHAFLPHRCVDHTHADSILVLTHQKKTQPLSKTRLVPKSGFYLTPCPVYRWPERWQLCTKGTPR